MSAEIYTQYKQTLAAILPSHMISADGFLQPPSGGKELIRFIVPRRRTWLTSVLLAVGFLGREYGATYYEGGGYFKVFRHYWNTQKGKVDDGLYRTVSEFLTHEILAIEPTDEISLMNSEHEGGLVHETFHDIQCFLYDYYPDTVDALTAAIYRKKQAICDWHDDSANYHFTAPPCYTPDQFFGGWPYGSEHALWVLDKYRTWTKTRGIDQDPRLADMWPYIDPVERQLGINEVIPVLLTAAAEGNTASAALVAEMFADAGLNADFHAAIPQYDQRKCRRSQR